MSFLVPERVTPGGGQAGTVKRDRVFRERDDGWLRFVASVGSGKPNNTAISDSHCAAEVSG